MVPDNSGPRTKGGRGDRAPADAPRVRRGRATRAQAGTARSEGPRDGDSRAGDRRSDAARGDATRPADRTADRAGDQPADRPADGTRGHDDGRSAGDGVRTAGVAGGSTVGPPLAAIAASLQRERRRAGLSLAETARRAGIAKSTLSQLESGVGNPSVETLWALSVTLDVPFAQLVDPPRPRVQVIRAGEGPAFVAERADYVATLLASCPPHVRRDIFLVTAQPGSPRESEPHTVGLIEHVVLCAGRALVGLADDPVELAPGDYVSYPGDVAHVFRALAPDTSAVLLSEHP